MNIFVSLNDQEAIVILFNFCLVYDSVFFKLLKLFYKVFDCSSKFYVLSFFWVILISKHFSESSVFDDALLAFHIIYAMRPGHVDLLLWFYA